MRQPRYGFVISVVAVLFLVGAFLRQVRPLIPETQPNRMIFESGDYMRQAAYQKVAWKPMSSEAFAEARRMDRPVLVVVGTPWSRVARELDRNVFIDSDVQAFLLRNFITVRIDGAQSPEWINAFLPFSRSEIGFLNDVQVWALDPSGKMFGQVFFRTPGIRVDPSWFLGRLVALRESFRRTRQEPWLVEAPGAMQSADLEILDRVASSATPDLGNLADSVVVQIDPVLGGFRTAGEQVRLLPQALRLLLLTERREDFEKAVRPVLDSPGVDWIDGGFFLRAGPNGWSKPDYDKLAIHNAELMHVLALADAMSPDPAVRLVALDAFDLVTVGMVKNGFVSACRRGDETNTGRSRRCSFPPKDLRSAPVDPKLFEEAGLEPFDVVEWCRDSLGLRVEENPAMLPKLDDPAVLVNDRKRFEVARKWLQGIAEKRWPTIMGGLALAETNLTVAARCISTARLWDDRERLARATTLFDDCSVFVSDGDVARGQYLSNPGRAYLGDYLAYADAALQDFLATGRVVSLESGLTVLLRARELFQSGRPGQWNLTTSLAGDPPDTASPEIIDNLGESCTARVLRLGHSYGRLFRGGGQYAGIAAELVQDAYVSMGLFGALAPRFGAEAGGFASAASILLDERHAVVVGPGCTQTAAELFRKVPTRLVAPRVGPVRMDLQDAKPGIYVVDGTKTDGPFTMEEAVRMLR